MTTKLSPTQTKLLADAAALAKVNIDSLPLMSAKSLATVLVQPLLVSGHRYRTACSLERMGIGTVRYQGPSLGWFALKDQEH